MLVLEWRNSLLPSLVVNLQRNPLEEYSWVELAQVVLVVVAQVVPVVLPQVVSVELGLLVLSLVERNVARTNAVLSPILPSDNIILRDSNSSSSDSSGDDDAERFVQ